MTKSFFGVDQFRGFWGSLTAQVTRRWSAPFSWSAAGNFSGSTASPSFWCDCLESSSSGFGIAMDDTEFMTWYFWRVNGSNSSS